MAGQTQPHRASNSQRATGKRSAKAGTARAAASGKVSNPIPQKTLRRAVRYSERPALSEEVPQTMPFPYPR